MGLPKLHTTAWTGVPASAHRGDTIRDAGMSTRNVDAHTVDGFGREWSTFDHPSDTPALRQTFIDYFSVFPWTELPSSPTGVDVGSGSGRWARYVAPRVGRLICLDASADAVDVARTNLRDLPNVEFVCSSIEDSPIPDGTLDFGYSLGVLHHVPDTQAALTACVRKLKQGAPFLVYLYYALDNRSLAFRLLWRASDLLRRAMSQTPFKVRLVGAEVIARLIYWPIARSCAVLDRLNVPVIAIPLSYYRDKTFYMMRNDALDRFGTKLEHRFTRTEVESMMRSAGLRDIRFRDAEPYWCAVGTRSA